MIASFIAIVILIVLSAFFSGSELAYTSLNQLRLEKAAEEKKPGAGLALRVEKNFEEALSTILIGNNTVNILCSVLATSFTIHLLGGDSGLGATIASAVVTVLILIFGEIIPKILARQCSLGFARFAAAPLAFLMVILRPLARPLVWLSGLITRGHPAEDESVTTEELSDIIETVEKEGVIDEEKSDLLQSALDFSEITVEEVLTPRTEMTAIDADEDMDSIVASVMEARYSRIPVYEGSIDNIIGVLIVNRFYKALAEKPLSDIRPLLAPPCLLHKTTRLSVAFHAMRQAKMHLAIVLDEYGGTMGIVTMEDLLEEIVGDIWDETDAIVTPFREVEKNVYEVTGTCPISDFFAAVDYDDREFSSEYTTMGGFATERLDSDPHVGDSFECGKLYVVVTEMEGPLVTRLSVTVGEEAEKEEDA